MMHINTKQPEPTYSLLGEHPDPGWYANKDGSIILYVEQEGRVVMFEEGTSFPSVHTSGTRYGQTYRRLGTVDITLEGK